LFAAGVAFALLGEVLTAPQLAGSTVVLLGVAATQRARHTRGHPSALTPRRIASPAEAAARGDGVLPKARKGPPTQ
jgi:hypothetical protein